MFKLENIMIVNINTIFFIYFVYTFDTFHIIIEQKYNKYIYKIYILIIQNIFAEYKKT